MRCFFLLLFLDGCLCTNEKTLTIEPHYLAGWKGSCILIPCQIKYTYSGRRLNNISLIWYFDPSYDGKEYTGTILYNSSRTSQKHVIPTIAGLQERATFAGNLSERNCSLKISQLQKSDDGSYGARLYGILENDFSKKKWYHPASLNILDAPKGVELRADPGTTLREGEKLSLECLVNSTYPDVLEYQWWKNNDLTNGMIHGSRMNIDPLGGHHSGHYKCGARNGLGTTESEELPIDVQYPPKETKIQFPSRTIEENDAVTLECSFTANPPITKYEWYKHSESNVIGSQRELHFQAIQPNDSGTYYCKAYNPIDEAKSSLFTLDVLYRPKDVQLAVLNSQPIKEGQTIQFNCSVGSSNPRTNWYKLLENNVVRTRPAESSLITSPAKPGRATTYHCDACNNVGCTSSPRISVNVHFAPKNVKAVRDPPGPIKEGAFLNLSCQVEAANPEEMTYRWSKDQQPLDAKGATLILQEVAPGDSGSYSCDATNSVGTTASRPLQLNVQYGPRSVSVTVDTKEAIIEGNNVLLRCENDAKPPSHSYKWYWNGEEIFQKTSDVLELQKVEVWQSGDYFCTASNEISENESQSVALIVSCE
nr:B-cell receptor CD22-like isoform X3 [Pogona vitticeps]